MHDRTLNSPAPFECPLCCAGVDAVTNGVLAAGNARLFLEKDGMDIKIQPEFTKLDKNGSQLSAMRFFIVSEPI
jgi:stage V sporulation protein SpoVS